MAIIFGCVSPHPPVIVPEIGRGREQETRRTVAALRQVAGLLGEQRPDCAILVATHGPLERDAFVVHEGDWAEGDFGRWGAPEVRLRFPTDRELAQALAEEAAACGLPVKLSDRWGEGLDWSCTVPLYFLSSGLGAARLLFANVSLLPPRQHFELGRAAQRAAERLGRRAAVVASADLSHRLSDDGPYGFDPAGPELDRILREAVGRWDVDAVLELDEGFRAAAGDDAVSSLSFLMGALDGLAVRARVLSYEAPFGVGYMVAVIDVLDGEGGARATEAAIEAG